MNVAGSTPSTNNPRTIGTLSGGAMWVGGTAAMATTLVLQNRTDKAFGKVEGARNGIEIAEHVTGKPADTSATDALKVLRTKADKLERMTGRMMGTAGALMAAGGVVFLASLALPGPRS